MKFGVIIFPGSNCDHDAFWTAEHVAKQKATFLWHDSHDLEDCDVVIVPGGFAYGDYLRTGAIAKFSPVMESVRKFAAGGGLVLGICNGFQILCESELLPGALMRNIGLKYVCKPVQVRVENNDTPFTNTCRIGEVLTIPIGPISELLPGALMRNIGLKYVCKPVQVRVENNDTPFTNTCRIGEVLTIPIGHMEIGR